MPETSSIRIRFGKHGRPARKCQIRGTREPPWERVSWLKSASSKTVQITDVVTSRVLRVRVANTHYKSKTASEPESYEQTGRFPTPQAETPARSLGMWK